VTPIGTGPSTTGHAASASRTGARGVRAFAVALFAVILAAVGVFAAQPAAAQTTPGTKVVSVSISGGYNYQNSGAMTSGNLNISQGGPGINAVQGFAVIPGARGGDATISFDVNSLFGLFPIYFGSISVVDNNARLALNTVVFFSPVSAYQGSGAQGSATWFTFFDLFNLRTYTLNWSIANAGVQPGDNPPVPSFTANPLIAVAPATVNFDASASFDPDPGDSIVKYQWNFGDGGTFESTSPTASHLYTNRGDYVVTLTVTNNRGSVASTQQTIVMTLPPNPPTPTSFDFYDAEGELFDDGRFYFRWDRIGQTPGTTVRYEVNVVAVAGCIAFGDKTRSVNDPGGTATKMQYTWVQSWPASNVCLGSKYKARVRAVRDGGPGGSQFSDWTPFQERTIDRT
jgi:PKD repeat protein